MALCPQSKWVVSPRWWNGVPLACYMYMLGLSGYNTENLTANHTAQYWDRCHIPNMLKNPTVVFSWSRNYRAPFQEAILPNPTHLSCFQWQSKFVNPINLVNHPIFHSIIISCSLPEYSWDIADQVLNPNNQSTIFPDPLLGTSGLNLEGGIIKNFSFFVLTSPICFWREEVF